MTCQGYIEIKARVTLKTSRFARDLAQLPPGVEVIVCSGQEAGSRDFDDFSTTEALISQGREEASEVVRRYGLGRPVPLDEATTPLTADGPVPSDPTEFSLVPVPDGPLDGPDGSVGSGDPVESVPGTGVTLEFPISQLDTTLS